MKKYQELKLFIKKHYKTYSQLADEMGIHRVTLEYKLNGFHPFTVEEIKWFKQRFNLTDKQVSLFFLA